MINVCIAGATGYTGIELLKMLLSHPEVSVDLITSTSKVGTPIAEIHPSLLGHTDLRLSEFSLQILKQHKIDVVFLAYPNGEAMKIVEPIINAGIKVVDLSADFRFTDTKIFEKWYKIEHVSEHLIKDVAYGLPEIIDNKLIKQAKIIANPGCYVTASILGLYPLKHAKLLDDQSIIVDAKSGVSGAGKTPTEDTHFVSVNESIKAYKIASHRHTPEIEQAIGGQIVFTPHLVPMTRGILATIYSKITKKVSIEEIHKIYIDYYADKEFVQVVALGSSVSTSDVAGTNNCHIALNYDKRTDRLIITSVIDNLIKGASGQAVQNMNILFGFRQTLGLNRLANYL